jgi:predicted amidophosphoribosyltransferase
MINSDRLLERLRERVMDDSYNHGHCDNCNADLTAADREAGACTNCHSAVESDDEHLYDDEG